MSTDLLGGDTAALVRRFHEARRDRGLVVLQGFHALKHALRFGAEVELAACVDPKELARLAEGLAPDLRQRLEGLLTVLPEEAFKRLGPYVPHTGVVAVARRAAADPQAVLADPRPAPVVLLEDPRHFGNLGAVIRVAAAAEAAGVLTTGRQDPWDPVAVRGSAGLHFALPVARIQQLPTRQLARMHQVSSAPNVGRSQPASSASTRPLVAFDPAGEPMRPHEVPRRAVLAFGTERAGCSEELLAAADMRVRLPMRDGVSSLNLATSVAAALYGLLLA